MPHKPQYKPATQRQKETMHKVLRRGIKPGTYVHYVPPAPPPDNAVYSLRMALRLTQQMLADQLGVPVLYIKRWEGKAGAHKASPGRKNGARLRLLAEMNGLNLDLMEDRRPVVVEVFEEAHAQSEL
jgi:hypothetical protein